MNHRGQPLNESSWRTILTNISYAGYVSYHRRRGEQHELVRGHFEPLVTLEEFEQAQRVRAQRSHQGGRPANERPYLLRGLATCLACGSRMRGDAHAGTARRYYRDIGPRSGACGGWSVRAEIVESQVEEGLLALSLPPQAIAQTIAILRRRQGTSVAAQERQRVQDALGRLREQYTWGHLDKAEYLSRHRELERQLARVPEPGQEVDLKEAARLLQNFPELYLRSSREMRQRLIRELLVQVQITMEGQVVGVEAKPQYLPLIAWCEWRARRDSNPRIAPFEWLGTEPYLADLAALSA